MRAGGRQFAALLGGVLFALSTTAPAGEIPAEVMQQIGRVVPGVSKEEVSGTPLPGLYEVMLGGQVLYISWDARYLLRGDLIDIEKRKNISEDRRKGARIAELDRLGESSMVVFKPSDSKYKVTVFTDVDCGYCAKMHREMEGYNERGIEVRYLAFPRAGVGSNSYNKMVSVWCADDQQQAMTDAKARRRVTPKSCDNPVQRHFELGQALGVNGTPTMILTDGRVVPGYLPPEKLLGRIESGR